MYVLLVRGLLNSKQCCGPWTTPILMHAIQGATSTCNTARLPKVRLHQPLLSLAQPYNIAMLVAKKRATCADIQRWSPPKLSYTLQNCRNAPCNHQYRQLCMWLLLSSQYPIQKREIHPSTRAQSGLQLTGEQQQLSSHTPPPLLTLGACARGIVIVLCVCVSVCACVYVPTLLSPSSIG